MKVKILAPKDNSHDAGTVGELIGYDGGPVVAFIAKDGTFKTRVFSTSDIIPLDILHPSSKSSIQPLKVIQGRHPGSSVIKTLERFGDKNTDNLSGSDSRFYYFVNESSVIDKALIDSFYFEHFNLSVIEPIQSIWRAPYGESYWYISDTLGATWSFDYHYEIDDLRFSSGNYFPTKRDAQNKLNQISKFFNLTT